MPNEVLPDDGEMRVVVVGKCGHGKSTVANALLGKDQFTVGSKTVASDIGQCSKNGLTVKVVDTPDTSENNMKRKEKQAEVNRWKQLAAPYPNILLLTVRADAPYTQEDFISYRQVRKFWGGRRSIKGRVVVVFTFAQNEDVNAVGERMERDNPKWVGKIFRDSGGRYVVYKGKSAGNILDEVMIDDSDDEEDDDEEERRGGGKRKGSAERGRSPGRKGSGKRKGSRSPGRKGSRSPGRKGSRSPGRKGSRSPGRKGSRSPGRKGSRSPKRKGSRSPGRKGSPGRRRSPSPGKKGKRKGPKKYKSRGGHGRRPNYVRRRGIGGIFGLLCCICK